MLAIQYAMMAMYYAALTMQCAIVTVDDAAWDRMTRRWTVYDAPAVADAVEEGGILGHGICDARPYNMRCRTIYYAPPTPLAARQKQLKRSKTKKTTVYLPVVGAKPGALANPLG